MVKPIKYLLYLLVLLCCSCHKEQLLQGKELCNRLEHLRSVEPDTSIYRDSILPILSSAGELSPVEHYGVICEAVSYCRLFCNKEMTEKCLQTWDSLRPIPRIHHKAEGFFLMEKFAYCAPLPQQIDLKVLSALLFDMENRQRLTPEERCRFLILKSGIYFHTFREYESAAAIAEEAETYANQHKINGKLLQEVHNMMIQGYFQSEQPEKMISLNHNLLASIENNTADSTFQKKLYSELQLFYWKQKDYHKAWYCNQKSGKKNNFYLSSITDIYLGMDSIPQLMTYLEKTQTNGLARIQRLAVNKQQNAVNLLLSSINYAKARAYLQKGDTIRYGQLLDTAIYHCDQISPTPYLPEMEAYIQKIWKQGRRNEAIHRREQLCQRIVDQNHSLSIPKKTIYTITEQRLPQLRLLTDYYRIAGRPEDALRQALLCDSMQTLLNNTRLAAEQCNNASRIYTTDLRRNLEQQRANYVQEQQRLAFTMILLGVVLVVAAVFALLYRRRQRELNALYAKQKEIEQLETTLSTAQPVTEELPADKQLYLRLERQMLDEHLFLNPDFSRDDLCQLAGSNRMYVSTSINKYAGMNLNQWINKARVNYAISLIHSGETNLQVLASDSGFSSTTSFFRNFKQFTLLTPKQYIEREKNNSQAPSL